MMTKQSNIPHGDVQQKPEHGWRRGMYTVIFEADTPAGKLFDVLLIVSIVVSVIAVMLNSVKSVHATHGRLLGTLEWTFTILFTIEYIARLICVGRPWRYAKSFYGLVDLVSALPTYLSLIWFGSHYLLVIRSLRVLRIFRVLKMDQYLGEAAYLSHALRASRRKITVFLLAVLTLVLILGSFMYVIEGEESGFTNIPLSVYWAIVTLTTVGYGDISPQTPLGQALAAAIMIMGYSIIAIPTGIVSAEYVRAGQRSNADPQACPQCDARDHDRDAIFCKFCGAKLEELASRRSADSQTHSP